MKKLSIILLILTAVSCKKEEINPDLTRAFSIHSNTNGANYTIKVALPDNYNPYNKYAAVYVLDGDDNFEFVAANCKKISDDLSTSNILVVSIGYGHDRTVDYTPTVTEEGDGGAEKFLAFIQDELIPRMENEFAADTSRKSRIILGHSFGGLCASYAFTNFNKVFGNYILLSPSLWYDNEILLRYEQENRNVNNDKEQLVFMGLGELESNGRMLAPYTAFLQRLQNNYSGMKVKSHLEPHLEHTGSRNPNILQGLNFYFHNR